MSLHELVRNPSKGSSRTFQIRFMISLRYSSGALRTLPEFFQNTFEIFTRIIQELFMNSPGTPQKLFRCSSGALQELLGDTSGILQELFKNSARTLQKGRGEGGLFKNSSGTLQSRFMNRFVNSSGILHFIRKPSVSLHELFRNSSGILQDLSRKELSRNPS